MICKLLNFLSVSLYRERDFAISKLDETHFSVKSRNGLNATITINDRIMFVEICFEYENNSLGLLKSSYSKIEKNIFRYSTPLNDSLLSFDDFVVYSIKNTILFKIKSNKLSSYFKEHANFFQDTISINLYHKIILEDLERIKRISYDQYAIDDTNDTAYICFYDYNIFDKKCYPIINFKKKKVINNIFKYTFHANKLKNMAKKEMIVAYYIDDVFFNLSDLETFFLHKSVKDKPINLQFMKFNFNPYVVSEPKKFYGINNQLTEHQSFMSKQIDLSKVRVLRHDGQQYCLLKKENRQLTLSYITNFDIEKTVVDSVLTYSSWWQKIMRNETPLRRYKNEYLITYTYKKGKLTKNSERFDLNMVKNHEMEIANQVMANADYLKTHYPSASIVKRLNEFGICSDIPLSLDDLSVLEMCEI